MPSLVATKTNLRMITNQNQFDRLLKEVSCVVVVGVVAIASAWSAEPFQVNIDPFEFFDSLPRVAP